MVPNRSVALAPMGYAASALAQVAALALQGNDPNGLAGCRVHQAGRAVVRPNTRDRGRQGHRQAAVVARIDSDGDGHHLFIGRPRRRDLRVELSPTQAQ
jgi:hypothetical protein